MKGYKIKHILSSRGDGQWDGAARTMRGEWGRALKARKVGWGQPGKAPQRKEYLQ